MNPWDKKRQERLQREKAARSVPWPTVNSLGEAVFPEGITEIRDRSFDGNQKLRTAILPNTVKRIGVRAFASCKNLCKLVLNEGLEEIESNIFTDCDSLHTVVFPDSVKKIEAFAFYQAHFQEPLFSASGNVLYRGPEIPGSKRYVVPAQVKEIQAGAFLKLDKLEEVVLPEGLEYIHCRSFMNMGLRKLTIPSSVRKVESKSFWGCRDLEEVTILCDSAAFSAGTFYACPNVKLVTPGRNLEYEEIRRIRGIGILSVNYGLKTPKRDFWADEKFASLARRCSTGDAAAMMEFADYYEKLGSEEFYISAANFWRFRAYLYGNQQAAQWKKDRLRDKLEAQIPVALNPYFSDNEGERLRALGFAFFDPERSYSFQPKDDMGIVEVSSWSETEGPDEDGFGMEECYDFWFLDEFLNPIPGIPMIGNYSSLDRRNFPEKFEYYHDLAAEVLRQKRGKNA